MIHNHPRPAISPRCLWEDHQRCPGANRVCEVCDEIYDCECRCHKVNIKQILTGQEP